MKFLYVQSRFLIKERFHDELAYHTILAPKFFLSIYHVIIIPFATDASVCIYLCVEILRQISPYFCTDILILKPRKLNKIQPQLFPASANHDIFNIGSFNLYLFIDFFPFSLSLFLYTIKPWFCFDKFLRREPCIDVRNACFGFMKDETYIRPFGYERVRLTDSL